MVDLPKGWTRIPLAELTKPKNGLCDVYVDYYWVVDSEDHVFIFRGTCPQANKHLELCERFKDNFKSMSPNGQTSVVKVGVAYLKANPSDYN